MGTGGSRGPSEQGQGALIALIILLTLCSMNRNAIWHDEVALWSDVVRKTPAKAAPLINLGSAYAEEGDVDEALRYFQRAYLLEPNSVDIQINMGNAYADLGRPDLAVLMYRKALAAMPNLSAETFVNIGNAYSELNKFDEAIDLYEKAMQIAPNHPGIFYNLGVVYERKGELSVARDYYAKALSLDPEYTQARMRMADMLPRRPLHSGHRESYEKDR